MPPHWRSDNSCMACQVWLGCKIVTRSRDSARSMAGAVEHLCSRQRQDWRLPLSSSIHIRGIHALILLCGLEQACWRYQHRSCMRSSTLSNRIWMTSQQLCHEKLQHETRQTELTQGVLHCKARRCRCRKVFTVWRPGKASEEQGLGLVMEQVMPRGSCVVFFPCNMYHDCSRVADTVMLTASSCSRIVRLDSCQGDGAEWDTHV